MLASILTTLLLLASTTTAIHENYTHVGITHVNSCIQFSVSAGTGCAWMCNYCAEQLGTNNYYFTDGVCSWEPNSGCTGSPLAGKMYTCCSASFDEVI